MTVETTSSSFETINKRTGSFHCPFFVYSVIVIERLVSEKTLKLVRALYYVDISKITKLELSEDIKQEINSFLDDYYDTYTGLYLKSKQFLKELNKVIQDGKV